MILEDVVFAYVKLQNPVKSLNEGDTEFSVDAIVAKAAAKVWNKEHPKNKAKAIDNEEFLEKYKFEEVPFEDQDEQFVIKFKKAHSKGGVLLPEQFRPRVLVKGKNGKNEDITFKTLVGNGSKGKVSYSTFTNGFGEFTQLSAILVEELDEYVSSGGGGNPGSDFGDFEPADVPAKNNKAVSKQGEADDEAEDEAPPPPKKPAPKQEAPKKPKAPAKKEAEDEEFPFD